MKFLLTSFLCMMLSAKALWAQTDNDWAAIQAVLKAQEKAWNEGNINEFMQGYWKSEKLKFVGKSGVQNGWQATLDRYLKNYPDRAAMGKLSFDLVHHEMLAKNTYVVIGKWHLQRDNDEPQGYFTLIFKKIKGKWYVIHDHTS